MVTMAVFTVVLGCTYISVVSRWYTVWFSLPCLFLCWFHSILYHRHHDDDESSSRMNRSRIGLSLTNDVNAKRHALYDLVTDFELICTIYDCTYSNIYIFFNRNLNLKTNYSNITWALITTLILLGIENHSYLHMSFDKEQLLRSRFLYTEFTT